MARFSERTGAQPTVTEITVRQDAPEELRSAVVDIAYDSGLDPHSLRHLVARALRKRIDRNNWSAYPNVDEEVRGHLDSCQWYEVYDIIEAVYSRLAESPPSRLDADKAAHFETEINKYFRSRGIGWQLSAGQIQTRGGEAFERTLAETRAELHEAGRATAANEIHEAISDLSRRPQPDVTGAIQHAIAALECVARDVTGDQKSTLETILSRYQGFVPPPLDQGLEKLWGFASEQGRHLREGREPTLEVAELVVQVAAAVSRYLSKVDRGVANQERNNEFKAPF